jgi:hypothetical protein
MVKEQEMGTKYSYRGDYRARKGPYEGSRYAQAYRDQQNKRIYAGRKPPSTVDPVEVLIWVGAALAAGLSFLIAGLAGSGNNKGDT